MNNFMTNLVDSQYLKSRNREQTNKSRKKMKMLSEGIKLVEENAILDHSNNQNEDEKEDELFTIQDNSILNLENSISSKNSESSFFDNNESDDSEDNYTTGDSFLYSGSNLMVSEFMDLFFNIKQKHNLSDSASNDLLKFIKIILPEKNKCPKTHLNLEKRNFNEQNSINYLVCNNCDKLFDSQVAFSEKKQTCLDCNSFLNQFVVFDIETQIFSILSNKNYLSQIEKSLYESYKNLQNKQIHKPQDGIIYKKYLIEQNKEENLLISLALNGDGAPMTSSKSYKIWPIIGTVLELDPSSREKFENLIFLGLWINDAQPNYKIFYSKCLEKLDFLMKRVLVFDNKKFKIRIQSLIFDLPAKASALNIKQFNGEYGCIACYHKGLYSHMLKTRIYPPQDLILKTKNDYEKFSQIAENLNEPIFGIYGKSCFHHLISIPEQVPFDYMHLVLSGHTKWLLKQFFFEKDNDSYIGNRLTEINDIISKHRVPNCLTRKFPKIQKNICFKSSELKIFIFHLALPLLKNILPDSYWYLLCLYVFSIRVLYEPVDTAEEIDKAKKLFDIYFKQIENFFGQKAYTYTLHAHKHLFEQVKYHGPLKCHSQFVYEGALFNIKNLIKGSRGYLHQVSRKIFFKKNLHDNKNIKNLSLQNFNEKFINSKKGSFFDTELINPFQKKSLDNDIFANFQKNHGKTIDNNLFICSDRCLIKGRVFHALSYNRKGNLDNYTVFFETKSSESVGQIIKFFEYQTKIFAIMNLFEKVESVDLRNLLFFKNNEHFQMYYQRYYTCLKKKCVSKTIIECQKINLSMNMNMIKKNLSLNSNFCFIKMSGNDFVCVYFKKDNTFTVYHDTKNKLQKCKSAKFKFENNWITGEIVTRGSFRHCNKFGSKLNAGKIETDFEETDFEYREDTQLKRKGMLNSKNQILKDLSYLKHFSEKIKSKSIKVADLDKTDISDFDSMSSDNESSSAEIFPNSSKKSCSKPLTYQSTPNSKTTHDTEASTEFSASTSCPRSKSSPKKASPSGMNFLEDKILKIEKNVSEILEILKRNKKVNNYPTEIMYNGKNLLNVRASNQTSFVSMIMDILFTHEEQNNGLVIKVKPTAKRSQLEPSRVQLLKDAFMIKFQIPENKIEDTWYSVGKIANRRCYDAAKRQIKA